MKVALLIDTLNSGGAQRQIVNLAVFLKRRKVDVHLIYYHPLEHFKSVLDEALIPNTRIDAGGVLSRSRKIRGLLLVQRPDVLLCFLDIPSVLGILASLPKRTWKLITSERVLEVGKPTKIRRILRASYGFVDAVTTNSFANEELIIKHKPGVKPKTSIIYNSVDLTKFAPSTTSPEHIRFLVVASFRDTKNPQGLFKAINLIKERKPDSNFELYWFGHKNPAKGEQSSKAYDEAMKIRQEAHLEDFIKICEPVRNIEDVYRSSSALILPSFTEGVPNVVCEAMACGLPIVMSDVADAHNLVTPEVNGFLFNPNSIDSMATSIIHFLDLDQEKISSMGKQSRLRAEELFCPGVHVTKYIQLFEKVIKQ